MADPKYVRLVDRMARSTQVDLVSGWSISGLDVKEFPEDSRAQAYIRDAIRRGTIEACSRSEYDEVNDGDHDFLAQANVSVKPLEVEGTFQEAHVAGLAENRRHEIEAARGLSSTGSSYGDEKLRRKALLAAQKRLDSGETLAEDDDEAAGVVDPDEAAAENAKVAEEQEAAEAKAAGRKPAGSRAKAGSKSTS
jgi:hypothetical protein